MDINNVKQLLVKAGFPDNSLMFALAQACFESGGTTFESENDLLDNNLTGIEWANNPATGNTWYWQHNATKGAAMPAADNPTGFYAHFNTLLDWAIDFKRIVHAQFPEWNNEGRPIDATTIEQYVHLLKLNHYFGSDEAEYLAGVKYYLDKLNS